MPWAYAIRAETSSLCCVNARQLDGVTHIIASRALWVEDTCRVEMPLVWTSWMKRQRTLESSFADKKKVSKSIFLKLLLNLMIKNFLQVF